MQYTVWNWQLQKLIQLFYDPCMPSIFQAFFINGTELAAFNTNVLHYWLENRTLLSNGRSKRYITQKSSQSTEQNYKAYSTCNIEHRFKCIFTRLSFRAWQFLYHSYKVIYKENHFVRIILLLGIRHISISLVYFIILYTVFSLFILDITIYKLKYVIVVVDA